MVRFITDSRPLPSSSPAATDAATPPLRAIGAGLPRAATSSLQAAFERLGLAPCLHMAHIIPHPRVSRLLLTAMREREDGEARRKMVRELVAGYAAVTDFPVVFLIEDLMDLYPEAKVVLNGRPSAEIWARSARESFGLLFSWRFGVVGYLWETDRLWKQLNDESVRWVREKLGVEEVFSAEAYERYYEYVRQQAKERGREIIEFKAEDGWKPLCEYLGTEVPKEEFPRLNEKKAFEIVKMVLVVRGVAAWATLGGGVWAAWKYGPGILDLAREWWTSGHMEM